MIDFDFKKYLNNDRGHLAVDNIDEGSNLFFTIYNIRTNFHSHNGKPSHLKYDISENNIVYAKYHNNGMLIKTIYKQNLSDYYIAIDKDKIKYSKI